MPGASARRQARDAGIRKPDQKPDIAAPSGGTGNWVALSQSCQRDGAEIPIIEMGSTGASGGCTSFIVQILSV
jgi:hypothetical protein